MQPNLVALAAEYKATSTDDVAGIERHLAMRLAAAPPLSRFLMLLASLRVFLADPHRRMRMQIETLFRSARNQLPEIEAGRPAQAKLDRLLLGLVAEVPDSIGGARLRRQTERMLILYSISVGKLHLLILADCVGYRYPSSP